MTDAGEKLIAEVVALGVIFKYFAGFSNSIVYTEKLPDLISEFPDTLIQNSLPLNYKHATLFPTVSATTEFCLKSNKLTTKFDTVQLMFVDGFLNSNTTFTCENDTKLSNVNFAIKILFTMLIFVDV